MENELKRWPDVFRYAQWGIAVESAGGMKFEFVNPEFARMHGYTVEELTGAAISKLFPDDCCQPPYEGGAGVRESRHCRKDGSSFPALVNVTIVEGKEGKALYRVVNVQDITKRKEMEEALARSEGRFSDMTNNVPGMVFQYKLQAPDSEGYFTYASEGSLALCGSSPQSLKEDIRLFLSFFSGEGKRSLFNARDESVKAHSVWNWEGRIFIGEEKWINLRATPRRLEGGGHIWDGVIFNITESKRLENEIEKSRELLRELTAHQDAVREEEQKRIAREIHDELGLALTALKIDIDWLGKRLQQADSVVDQKLEAMSGILDKTVESVRRIAEHLRPGMLDDLGLAAAIEWQVENFGERTGIHCALKMNREEFELDERLSTCVFRVVQEALTNVARHAEASRVLVRLDEEMGRIRLEISDDGKGFKAEARRRSFGILGIKERIHMLGGDVEISSGLGKGTTVKAGIPIGRSG
jgi:PAS domain S-box-containing protein